MCHLVSFDVHVSGWITRRARFPVSPDTQTVTTRLISCLFLTLFPWRHQPQNLTQRVISNFQLLIPSNTPASRRGISWQTQVGCHYLGSGVAPTVLQRSPAWIPVREAAAAKDKRRWLCRYFERRRVAGKHGLLQSNHTSLLPLHTLFVLRVESSHALFLRSHRFFSVGDYCWIYTRHGRELILKAWEKSKIFDGISHWLPILSKPDLFSPGTCLWNLELAYSNKLFQSIALAKVWILIIDWVFNLWLFYMQSHHKIWTTIEISTVLGLLQSWHTTIGFITKK